MAFNNSESSGKPEACSLANFFRGEKRIKDFVNGGARHSASGIAYPQHHVRARFGARRHGCVLVVHVEIFSRDGDRTALGHGVAGVDGQIK